MNLKAKDLNYDIQKLMPVFEENDFYSHYENVYVRAVEDFNSSSGDIAWNKAAAHCHELFFENIKEYDAYSLPDGKAYDVIASRYGDMDKFVDALYNTALKLQGAGWIYMNRSGYLNIIPNCRIVDDMCLIIDMHEHSYFNSYKYDKFSYVSEFLRLVDWDVVNKRIANATLAAKKKHF